ncbi:MAG TPA: glycoside hydrolase family protein [Vicinamibacterales bacterium]
MTDRQKLVQHLVLDEGLRLKLYPDTLGVPTIGVGRNVRDKGLSSDEAFLLLDHDIDESVHDLTSFAWFPNLSAVRQRVIVNMRFNLGPIRFREFKTMIHCLAIGDIDGAANEITNSLAAKQNMNRYNRLARMMRTDFDEVNG